MTNKGKSSNKRNKPSGTDSANSWGIRTSYTFGSATIVSGVDYPVPHSQTRYFAEKRKPVSGKSPLVNGWRAPTGFQGFVAKLRPGGAFDYTTGDVTILRHYGGMGYSFKSTDFYYGCLTSSNQIPRTSTNLVNRAQVECVNKIKEDSANLAESLATLDQTLGMLAGSVIRLSRAIHYARRGQWKRSADVVFGSKGSPNYVPRTFGEYSAGVSQHWLEYIYGWKPLIQDIMFLLELAKQQNRDKNKFITVTRRLEEPEPLPKKVTSGAGTCYMSGERTNGVFVRCDCTLSSPALFLLDQLGLVNPLLLGWELIPYSFLIDWILPIGHVLQALTASFGVSFKGMSTTTYTRMTLHQEWSNYSGSWGGTPISCDIHTKCWKRVTFTSFPLPRLYYKSPFTSLTRLATALALLTSRR